MSHGWLRDFAVVVGTAVGVLAYCAVLVLAIVGLFVALPRWVLGPVCSGGFHCVAPYFAVGSVLFGLGLWPLARLYSRGTLRLPDAW